MRFILNYVNVNELNQTYFPTTWWYWLSFEVPELYFSYGLDKTIYEILTGVYNGRLWSTTAQEVLFLPTLNELDLSHNQLTSMPVVTQRNMPMLQYLNLRDNKIEAIDELPPR